MILLLFDIDGTLTDPRKRIDPEMLQHLQSWKSVPGVTLGIVGGSDRIKAQEQLGEKEMTDLFEYAFSENGLVFYHKGVLRHEYSLTHFISPSTLNRFINYVLLYLCTLELPVKTGTFIEYRKSMLNISPVGRNCSQEQRDDFEIYDQEHRIRETMIMNLKEEFPESEMPVEYGIGGQISFDVFPRGLNKTFCLEHLPLDEFDTVYFFGDKTEKGGNDYEIYHDPRVQGRRVTSWQDTASQVQGLLRPDS
jgi:phosphomannomutase